MSYKNYEFVIVGAGMVGLSIAYQLVKRKKSNKILVIEKEKKIGMHSSGRNSGVLHAGLYYEPNSLKAKVCVSGAKRLKEWIIKREIPINNCGKIIVPTKLKLDPQIDLLMKRGTANGAEVKVLNRMELKKKIPEARSASGRAIWSPNTSVVKPITVINKLKDELEELGVVIKTNLKSWEIDPDKRTLSLNSELRVNYDHLINCAGLQADRIARIFSVGREFSILPFKGIYWKISNKSKIKIKTNLYPVPDLNVPFLGVHFTPNAEYIPSVSIGPTAVPAWGRENYKGYENLEPSMALKNLSTIIIQYINNKGGFRKYAHEQAFLSFPLFFLNAAKELIPSITFEDIELSEKVGIRSQLFNHKTKKLENDFICLHGTNSTHILNAISPAFTASFSLADLIIDKIEKNEK